MGLSGLGLGPATLLRWQLQYQLTDWHLRLVDVLRGKFSSPLGYVSTGLMNCRSMSSAAALRLSRAFTASASSSEWVQARGGLHQLGRLAHQTGQRLAVMPLPAEFLGGLRDASAGLRGAPAQLAHALALDLGVGGDLLEFVLPLGEAREVEAVGFDDAVLLVAAAEALALRVIAHHKDAGLARVRGSAS